jgi:hypothetical protein
MLAFTTASALQSLAFVRFGGFHGGRGGGILPLLLIAAVVGVAAWALARRDPAKS